MMLPELSAISKLITTPSPFAFWYFLNVPLFVMRPRMVQRFWYGFTLMIGKKFTFPLKPVMPPPTLEMAVEPIGFHGSAVHFGAEVWPNPAMAAFAAGFKFSCATSAVCCGGWA